MPPLDSEVSYPSSCWQRRQMLPKGVQVSSYLYVWNKNIRYGRLIVNDISRRQKGELGCTCKNSVTLWMFVELNVEQAYSSADSCSKWMNISRSMMSGQTNCIMKQIQLFPLLQTPTPNPGIANTNMDYCESKGKNCNIGHLYFGRRAFT